MAQLREQSEESDDDELLDEIPPMNQPRGGARTSVSAEAYGNWNKPKPYVPVIHPKSDEQKARLKVVLQRSFLFASLESADFDIVVDAMQEQIATPFEILINQGDEGDFLFVVESGQLDCVKRFDDGSEALVKTCLPNDVFGELALLYNTNRAATVTATTDCALWKLDRGTFNAIVKEAASKKRERHETFLKSVEVLEVLSPYEISSLADAVQRVEFQPNFQIIAEGDEGSLFYMIEQGTAEATKEGRHVLSYSTGSYFGELALLRNQPRVASVMSGPDGCICLTLDRGSFTRLLGSLSDILESRSQEYSP